MKITTCDEKKKNSIGISIFVTRKISAHTRDYKFIENYANDRTRAKSLEEEREREIVATTSILEIQKELYRPLSISLFAYLTRRKQSVSMILFQARK